MKAIISLCFISTIMIQMMSCNSTPESKEIQQTNVEKKEFPKDIYVSNELIITQQSPNSYSHTTYMELEKYGKVPCNGMIVVRDGECMIFDIPADNKSSQLLIDWIYNHLAKKILGIVITHFHEDSAGGLQAFHDHSIPSFASNMTIQLLKKKHAIVPQNGFDNSYEWKVGDDVVLAKFFGEGHTIDNIIGYYSRDKILFGGCLVKELDASKGNLEDANQAAWPSTIQNILNEFPEVNIVIPGHGKSGGKELLEYTIKLFSDTTVENN